MSHLVQASIASLPVQISPALDNAVRYFGSKLERDGLRREILADVAPNEQERHALSQRSANLDRWLAPANDEWLIKELLALSAARAPREGTPETRKLAMSLYLETLRPLPTFAVAEAFKSAHRGEIGNKAFMPSEAELYAAATKAAQPLRAEKMQIENILTAKVVQKSIRPDQRKKLADDARAVAATFKMNFKSAEFARLGREFNEAEQEREPDFCDNTEARDAHLLAKLEAIASTPVPKLSQEALDLYRTKMQPSHHAEAAE